MNQLNVSLQHSIATLAANGWSARKIAREMGVHRETVGRYLRPPQPDSKPAIPPPGSREDSDSKPAIVPAGSKAGRTSQPGVRMFGGAAVEHPATRERASTRQHRHVILVHP